ncbi:MAG: hypothetical protein ACXWIH_16585 [Burkholderiales bacterium]
MGLLLSCFDYSPVAEDEFHDWYDTEHIPERQRVPGFVDCHRWLAVDRPRSSIATYDLAAVDVLRSPGYLAIAYENNSPWTRRVGWRCIKLLRFEGEQIAPGDELPTCGAAALLVWAFNLDGATEGALIDWFESDHRPSATNVPGVHAARLFRATTSTHRYVALYHLTSTKTPESAEWHDAVEDAWTQRFGTHERDRFRMLAERYVRRT